VGIESADGSDQYIGDDLAGEDDIILQPGTYDVSGLEGAKGEILRAAFARVANEDEGDDDIYTQYSGAISDPDSPPSDKYQDPGIIQYNPYEQ
jgi:hypothetical protein